MRGSAHLLLTAAVAAPVAYAVTRDGVSTTGLTVAIALASTLPDLDHPASLAAGLLRVRGGAAAFRAKHRHRSGWTHSLLACLGWPAVLTLALWLGPPIPFVSRAWALGCFAILATGGIAHLLEDALPWGSRSGIPLFAPFSQRQWKLSRTRRRPRPTVVPVSSAASLPVTTIQDHSADRR